MSNLYFLVIGIYYVILRLGNVLFCRE